MLRDETISKLPDTNVNNKILLTATKFCKTRNETLSTKETDFFTNYITKTSDFFGLQKILKSEEIEKL